MTERLEGYDNSQETLRRVSPGAEANLGVKHQVHEFGFVYLNEYSGDDAFIAEAARTSYGKGTKTVNDDVALERHLMRHRHTSPFEMATLTFHIKLPIFGMRQIVRHRTASLNEYSARYSILSNEFYIPTLEYLCAQSTANKQGRSAEQIKEAQAAQDLIRSSSLASYAAYEELLELGVTRELARAVVPVNVYTECYWKMNLHNLLHFLKLRMDPHAQQEIRDYANVIATITEAAFPNCWQAFEDYVLNSVTFSVAEMKAMKQILETGAASQTNLRDAGLSSREMTEFKTKFERIGSDPSLTNWNE